MQSIIYSFVAGISTVLGVLILLFFGKPNKKMLSGLLGFAAGIMIAISLFDLIPEALELGSVYVVAFSFLLGVGFLFIIDHAIPHAHVHEPDTLEAEVSEPFQEGRHPLHRTGYLVLFAIALHNLPEGLAIGAGLESSPQLGLTLAIAIALHNIPEGIAIAGPMRAGGVGRGRIVLLTLAAGLMTPLGAIVGQLVFFLSDALVGGALAFAAGCMMYIALDELVPNANKLHTSWANIGVNAAIVIGLLL